MKQQKSNIEWRIFDNDAEWSQHCAQAMSNSPTVDDLTVQKRHIGRRFYWDMVASAFLLINLGGWWWYTTPRGDTPQLPNELCEPAFTSTLSGNATSAELEANRRALSEFQASVAGMGHFAEPFNYRASQSPPRPTP